VFVETTVDGKTATLDPYPADPARLLGANKKFKVIITTGAKSVVGLPSAGKPQALDLHHR
jgi:hypothetical protein